MFEKWHIVGSGNILEKNGRLENQIDPNFFKQCSKYPKTMYYSSLSIISLIFQFAYIILLLFR